ncbi:hypothetical protein [Arthrobacter pascens]|uniref:hypothetical protein n=1 Tax=Arthrobacter pascens TaxID=1677 RepID=UPI0027D8C6D8|nr:hypothetical protein [Arthrobacter pascens]
MGDLPEQVAAVSGIKQATGSVVWNEAPDVSTTAVNPWNESSGWLPKTGDRVEIWAGDGVTYWQQFTGAVDETSGDVFGLPQSSIIDDYDKLNARFSHEPLMRIMPPRVRAAADYRAVGLKHLYYADAALRAAGFYATPPAENRTIVSVPAQSSMWPEVGVMTAGVLGGPDAGATPWCSTYNGPSGVSMADVLNTYSPHLAYPMTEPVRFSMTVGADHSGNTTMKAYYGATDYVELAVAGSRTAIARLNGVQICSLVMGAATRVSLLVKAGVWTLRTNTAATATGSVADPTAAVMERITISADVDSRAAGFHAVHTSTSTENLYTNYTPTARYRMENLSHLGLMDAGPTIEPTTCRDVLEQISKATLTGMWIDEAGVFQWAPSVGLKAQASVQTLTDVDDLRSLSWSSSLLGVRSKVEGSYDLPTISCSRWDNILGYQGNTETLESGQVKSEFISPPSGTDWVGLSQDYLILGEPGASAPSNSGHGSVTGAVLAGETTEEAGSSYLTSTFEQINVNTYKLVHTAGALPTGKKLELRYPSTSTTIWPRWFKEAFPLLRWFGKTDWAKQTLDAAIAGPAYAPVLAHDCGPWVSKEADTIFVQRIIDSLAAEVNEPAPVITGMRVGYDPRRQLGDVITISSPELLGITLTALIVSVKNGADGPYMQSLGVRIITAATTFTTYGEFEAAHADTLTYEQWRLLFPDTATYSTFNSDPLEGATP